MTTPKHGSADMAPDLTLDVRHARIAFGGLVAVQDVSLSIRSGEVLGLVGPNGAGKTTLLNAISGLVNLTDGEIWYQPAPDADAVRLTEVAGWKRPHLGIARTFQDSRLVPGLPVVDQLAAGVLAVNRSPGSAAATWLRLPSAIRRDRATRERAREIASTLGLTGLGSTDIDLLSAPQRRLVDLGRALMSRPRLLLLDEIAAGMPPADKDRVVEIVQRVVKESGTTVVLVEHDMGFVRSLADQVVVVSAGLVIAGGDPEVVLREPAVLEAYIGGKAARSIS